jgi:hypothetical protein
VTIGDLEFTYGNVLLFGLAVFLLMGVISFIRQGLKVGAVIVGILMVLAFAAGVLNL